MGIRALHYRSEAAACGYDKSAGGTLLAPISVAGLTKHKKVGATGHKELSSPVYRTMLALLHITCNLNRETVAPKAEWLS